MLLKGVDLIMKYAKVLSLLMIEALTFTVLFGCSGDIGKSCPETKAADIYQTEDDFETESAAEYGNGIHVDHTSVLNPVNENYIIAEISGEGVQCGEFTMFECSVKRNMTDESSAWLKKIYVPNSALGSIKGYTAFLAAIKAVSYEDGLISDDGRSYSVNMRNDGSLCCIPFDENGAAVVDDMHYLDLRYGDDSEYMVNGDATTPYQYVAAVSAGREKRGSTGDNVENVFYSTKRKCEDEYYTKLLNVLPDYLIQNGTSEEDIEKYFDALEKAKKLEDNLFDRIDEAAVENGILICY